MISNEAPEPANHVVVRLYIDARATILLSTDWDQLYHQLQTSGNTEIPVTQLHMNWSVPMKLPIWEGERFRVNDQKLVIGLPAGVGEYVFGWRLSSPRMPPKQRFYSIVSNGSTITIVEYDRKEVSSGLR